MHKRIFPFVLSASSCVAGLIMVDSRHVYRNQLRFTNTFPPDMHTFTKTATTTVTTDPNIALASEMTTKAGEAGQSSPNVGTSGASTSGVEMRSNDSSSFLPQDEVTEKSAIKLDSSGANSFKLYGGDPRHSVTDDKRVFSSSTFSSYDPSPFVEEARALSGIGKSMSRIVPGASTQHSRDIQEILGDNPDQNPVTLASVAAATVSMTSEMKKSSGSASPSAPPISQKPQQMPNSSSSLLRFGETKSDGTVDNNGVAPRGELGATDERGEEEIDEEGMKENERPIADAKENNVRVFVRDHMRAPVSVERLHLFADLEGKLPKWLKDGIQLAGYVKPTLVQSVAIPLFMEGRDVVGVAPTGSGKTVAFALPALAAFAALPSSCSSFSSTENKKRDRNSSRSCEDGDVMAVSPHVLVLCPTRELVQQTKGVFSQLAGTAVRVKAAFGGQDREQQIEFLRRWGGCDVLVSTPGRLCDFVEADVVSLKLVDFWIMDEADRMLELGFAPQLEFIMSNIRKCRRPRQTTMWTATWSATVGGIAARFLRPARVLLEVDREHKTNADITQELYPLRDPSQRIHAIVKLYDDSVISKRQQVIIFVNHKDEVEKLAMDITKALRAPPALVSCLHGGMRQRKRENIMHDFKNGNIRILCATDVAARGLDVPELDHVINYDLPRDTDAYVHRIGRTGRAGRRGTAHTFILSGDPRVPLIARFIMEQTGKNLSNEVVEIIRDVELHCGTALEYKRFRNHASVSGKDWRMPSNGNSRHTEGSRYVRGVGHVMTVKRPQTQKGN